MVAITMLSFLPPSSLPLPFLPSSLEQPANKPEAITVASRKLSILFFFIPFTSFSSFHPQNTGDSLGFISGFCLPLTGFYYILLLDCCQKLKNNKFLFFISFSLFVFVYFCALYLFKIENLHNFMGFHFLAGKTSFKHFSQIHHVIFCFFEVIFSSFSKFICIFSTFVKSFNNIFYSETNKKGCAAAHPFTSYSFPIPGREISVAQQE